VIRAVARIAVAISRDRLRMVRSFRVRFVGRAPDRIAGRPALLA
jgi:hypothetical protein